MMCVIGQFRSLLLAVWFPVSKYSPGVTHPEYIAQPSYHGMRHLAYSWLKKEADRCHENVFVFIFTVQNAIHMHMKMVKA